MRSCVLFDQTLFINIVETSGDIGSIQKQCFRPFSQVLELEEMATSGSELDNFRKKWKTEIEERSVPNTEGKRDSSHQQHPECHPHTSTSSKDRGRASSESDKQEAEGDDTSFNVVCPKDARKRKNTLKPFIIAENLLMGERSVSGISQNTESCESDIPHLEEESTVIKEQYLTKNKKIKLHSEVSVNQKPHSFLDIFISDLVSTCIQKETHFCLFICLTLLSINYHLSTNNIPVLVTSSTLHIFLHSHKKSCSF